ncbi:MAG: metallophosphoesterase family protein [Brumimicrobium sp.]|nr:metallophosphoesterase family protein [Brumimicrobium sp.]
MKIGLLSDTHGFLDPALYKYLREVDEIWHAGDVGTPEILEELRSMKPCIAVYGNIDHGDVKIQTREFERFEREGISVLMTHIAGKPGKYSKHLFEELTKNGSPDLLVCGHSHILLVKKDERFNMLWMNPGACGNHGFHKFKTLLRFEINSGRIENLEAIELGRRG